MAITSSRWWPVAAMKRSALSLVFGPLPASTANTNVHVYFSAQGERPRSSKVFLNTVRFRGNSEARQNVRRGFLKKKTN